MEWSGGSSLVRAGLLSSAQDSDQVPSASPRHVWPAGRTREGVWRYFEFMGEIGWASFNGSFRAVLSANLAADGSAINARAVGIDLGGYLQLQQIVVGVVPYVLTNPGSPTSAWEQLTRVGPAEYYWAKQLVQGLQKTDPPALQRLFEGISGNPDAPKARVTAMALAEAHAKVLGRGQLVRRSLASRLRVKS
jgi:hypothetical protein